MAQLIIERGTDSGKRIKLTTFPVTIGRDATNNIVLDDNESSRFHLKIKNRGHLYILEDLESKNGTYLNGEQVLNTIIKSGDKILVGSTELKFVASGPAIQMASEILKFDMVIAEELGINGPIQMTQASKEKGFKPKRINPLKVHDETVNDNESIRKIFELHSNILVINELEEAANTLLKSIHKISSKVSRAALFAWNEGNHQLVPISSTHFSKKKNKEAFLLSQRSMEDCLSRKKGIILSANSPNVTHNTNKTRVILPIIHNENTLCILHLEVDSSRENLSDYEVKMIQSLLNICSPSLDSLLLRREQDTWMVGIVETMIATIEAKDTYTVGHSERVCRYSMAIADELKLNREVKKMLMISSLCHDIGKIGIPDSILKKASRLSADEYEEMKLHPTIGADIISHMPNAQRFLSGVKYHHEKWDGTGYPEGLVGEEIPFFGRIIAVADVFDAMISGRSYSGFIDESDAIDKLQKEKDVFDPEILKALTNSYEGGKLTQKTSTQSQEPEVDRQEVTINKKITTF